MMSLLKWQAKILNKLFKTNSFEEIILDQADRQKIDYRIFYRILDRQKLLNNSQNSKHLKFNFNQIAQSANHVCQTALQSSAIWQQILKFNIFIESFNGNSPQIERFQHSNFGEFKITQENILKQQESIQKRPPFHAYTIEHVIIYSSLSKCKFWPKMIKSSSNVFPSLVEFYKRFTQDFSTDLSFKFDPLILSHKYEKVIKRISQKKKQFPELFHAIQNNDWIKIVQLIEKNQSEEKVDFINECKKDNYFVCHYASIYSTLEIIKNLYEKYSLNFQREDQEKQTALFFAIKRNSLQIVTYLVETVKVNINHKQDQNRTPIYLAAYSGNLQIVNYLYSKGANPQMESKLSRTPLSKACYLGNASVAEFLIKIGVSLTTIDKKGRTALHNAAWGIQGGRNGKKRGSAKLEDSPQCVQLLLKAGHPPDIEDLDGFTPLMSAAASLAVKSMRILIKNGANLNHKTKKNENLVFIAAKYGHLESLKILIQEYKCDYEEKNIYGISGLDASFTLDSSNVSKYLLDLYYKNNKQLNLLPLLNSICYYQKYQNLLFLKEWAQSDSQKLNYIYSSFISLFTLENRLAQDLFEKEKSLLSTLLIFFESELASIHHSIVQFILCRSVIAYTRGLFPNFPQFIYSKFSIFNSRNIPINNLEIQIQTKEEDIIKILSIDTNLTETKKSAYRCMLFLVKRRMTKVLLWILTLHKNRNINVKPSGFYKFSNEQIEQILRYETEEHHSIENYCFIHGIHDAIKILQLSQKQLKIFIPKYEFSFEIQQNPHSIGILYPVKECYFDLKYLLQKHLSEEQADFYQTSMKNYDKKINLLVQGIQMIENQKDIQILNIYFKKCRLIGIDIEHYNNSKEQFVCLVQVSGLGKTFLIDALKIQKIVIKTFLEQILTDQNKIKIFHSYDQDLKWIKQDFYVDTFKSVIDTSKIYGILNSKNKSPSLKFLAELFLSQTISKDFQRSDWRIRPLFKEMITYAGVDSLLLPFIFLKQLMEANAEIGNQKDMIFWQQIKKQFGSKRHVKSKGKKNILKLFEH